MKGRGDEKKPGRFVLHFLLVLSFGYALLFRFLLFFV